MLYLTEQELNTKVFTLSHKSLVFRKKKKRIAENFNDIGEN